MLDPGDGNFGTISNKQHWDTSYRNDNGWHDLGRPAGQQCDVNSFPDGWACRFEAGSGNTNEWNHWDRMDD